jgi:hypothetical protein
MINNQSPITKPRIISVFPRRVEIRVGLFPANTLIRSSGLHSLAFGFGTFAYACKRPSFLASRRFAT